MRSGYEGGMELLDRIGLVLGRDPNLGTVFERLATAFGDRPLVEQAADEKVGAGALRLTYRQASVDVSRLAAAIAAGAGPGERVVVAVPNGYRFLLLCVAASRAGCVAVPVNPQMTASEIDHVIDDCGATLVVRGDDDLPRRRGLPPAQPAATSPPSSTRRAPPASRRACSSATGP
jgi:acyl-CoA synthetase (AMP-forming)/AMP-acid ligase II